MKAYEGRWASKLLSGSWIVFAKNGGQNHYLAISPHLTDTDPLYDDIKKDCRKRFPYLLEAQP